VIAISGRISMDCMEFTENAVDKIRDALRGEMQLVAVKGYEYMQRKRNGIREKGILCCLKKAIQLTAGMIVLSENQLVDSMSVLHRALFESLIWCYWIVQSEENADYFNKHATDEMARLVNRNIENGYAGIYKREDNSELTSEEYEKIFSRYQKPEIKKLKDMADEVGLGRAYTMIYGLMSLEVHPSNLFYERVFPDWSGIYANLSGNIGFLHCIHMINTDWIMTRQQTPVIKIRKVLGA
jgi:hypothetical protein